MTSTSAESLKKTVFEKLGKCRQQLAQGKKVDMSGIEQDIRAFCTAVAGMPAQEGRHHAGDLKMLMQTLTDLNQELIAARNRVQEELEGLGRLKEASAAYRKSDAIAGKRKPKETKP